MRSPMDKSMNQEAREQNHNALGRREVLMGGMALGALVLTGCNATGQRAGTGSSSVRVGNGPMVLDVPSSGPKYSAPSGAVGNVSVLPRRAWTSSGIARPSEAYPMSGVSRITVHHSGVDSTGIGTQAQAARQIESIRKAHVSNGWADIGYHFIIDPQGRVWAGRPIDRQGAHVKDENEHNLGVMVMGNFDRQMPTGAALDSLQSILAMQMRGYRVPLGRVYTHRELRPTACPGKNLQPRMIAMRSRTGALAMIELEGAGTTQLADCAPTGRTGLFAPRF